MPIATTLRCLAVRQPWAWAICDGEKTIENRVWTTDYRGPLAIQASASKQRVNALARQSPDKVKASTFPCGVIIGVVNLVDVVIYHEGLDGNLWATGPYCWILENARFLERPIPYKGKLHLYKLPDEITSDIHKQLLNPATSSDASGILDLLRPDPTETWIQRAQILYGNGHFEAGIRCCTEAIKKRSDNAYAFVLRSAIYNDSKQYELALADCNRALSLNPNDARGYYLRKLTHEGMGNAAKAEADFRKAIELDPSVAESGKGPVSDEQNSGDGQETE